MSRPFEDDSELIAGCLEGSKPAWDSFVDRFSKLIYWSIHRVLETSSFASREEIADEVFQELFKRLLDREELRRLKAVGSIRKFLCVMASRMTLDRLRSLTAAQRRGVELDESMMTDTAEPLLGEETRLVIERVLADLPARDKACIEFHYLDGKTHREIGEILGIPQDTVSTIIRRTKDKLKAQLIEKGLGPDS